MTDSQGVVLLCGLVVWCVSIGCAAGIGAQKQARFRGMTLGLIFGPLGIIMAGFVDDRPVCANCGGRTNGHITAQFPVCQHCGCESPLLVELPSFDSPEAAVRWGEALDRARERVMAARA